MRMRGAAAWCAAGLLVVASGCADSGDEWSTSGQRSPSGSITLTNCAGKTATLAGPAKRIVTSNASALELLLRLGASDRVIGTGFPPGSGSLPPELDAKARQVPVLSRTTIPKEKLLGSGADLYIDSFSASGGRGMGEVASENEFRAAGITHMYLTSTACPQDVKGPLTDLSGVERDIRRLGEVTGTTQAADQLAASQREKLDGVRKALDARATAADRPGYFVFDYDAGTDQPTVICNRQIGHSVITLAGARNVFADCDDARRQVGWEDVVARNPDWIQIAVRNRPTDSATRAAFDEAESWLRTHPATRGLRAVRENHLLRLGSEVTTVPSVENATAVRIIAKALHPGLDLPDPAADTTGPAGTPGPSPSPGVR
ncbi:ABC transporter substrate-binding protein [Streptomyces sp. NPDC058200]|uniref:ABC transporter substrate-binding protein n=1 Tax=Streptomyces sp. NPDC058200 TaxID=3346378 RepID=UPI0036E06A73